MSEAPSDYRPDIDGLRAVAVAIVVLHHVALARGGFVGVDIFFVISGYLITRIILREIDAGSFSLLDFYTRRARRIFPALAAVLLASSLAATFLLFPNELMLFGKSLVHATFFVANIFFYREQGYFSLAGDVTPLLHTWSLAVEEQFYIAFPLLLLLVSRMGRRVVLIMMWALFAISLALAVYLVKHDTPAAFFLFPPRAWELLLGSLLAARAIPEIPQRYREPVAIAALAAILIATLTYHDDTPFPGLRALVPCLAAAALIHVGARGTTRVGTLLASAPFVALGLVSYSLYLWHWPLITFYKAYTGTHLDVIEKLILCLVSIAAAFASWRYIEQPFRAGHIRRVRIFSYSALAAAATCSFAIVFIASEGLATRYPESLRRIAAFKYDVDTNYRVGECFIDAKAPGAPTRVADKCLTIDAAKEDFLIIGDSHAAHYWAGFAEVFPEINFLQATANGCKPTYDGDGAPKCRSAMVHVLKDFLPHNHIDAIILSARWSRANLRELLQTIDTLKGRVPNIIVLGPIAGYDEDLPRLLARANRQNNDEIVRQSRDRAPRSVDKAFADALLAKHVRYISVIDLLCGPTYECRTTSESGLPLQFDRTHLTKEGAAEVAKLIRERGLFSVGG